MEACTRALLVDSSHCRIERCRCGVLHVTIGPLTFRTTPDILAAIASATSSALGALEIDDLRRRGAWRYGGGAS
jgi:hypothetical protein